jgi:hypothetical protein
MYVGTHVLLMCCLHNADHDDDYDDCDRNANDHAHLKTGSVVDMMLSGESNEPSCLST